MQAALSLISETYSYLKPKIKTERLSLLQRFVQIRSNTKVFFLRTNSDQMFLSFSATCFDVRLLAFTGLSAVLKFLKF